MKDKNVKLSKLRIILRWVINICYMPQLESVNFSVVFTPQPLRAVGVLFSPMVSGWVGGWAVGGKSLSGLYLRNCKVLEVDTW